MIESNPGLMETPTVAIPASSLQLGLASGWGIRESDDRTVVLIGSSSGGGPILPLVSTRFLTRAEAPSMSWAAAGIVTGLGTALNELQVLEGAETELGAGPAHRIVATCRQGIFALALDYILIERADGILWMGLTCLTDDYDAASRHFDAMASSVRATVSASTGP